MAFSKRKTRTSKKSADKSVGHPAKSAGHPAVIEPHIPEHFRCPISLELMKDPVTAPTGITYDRQSIERWLDMGNSTCPITKKAFGCNDLIPNHTILRLIQGWCVVNQSHGIELIPTPRVPISQFEAFEILSNLALASNSRDDEQCLELARIVRSYVKESERNRKCFLSIGAPFVLASAFRVSHSKPLIVLVEILSTLSSLLPFDDEIAMWELGTSESLDSIMRIMTCGDISSRFNAVLTLKKIASTNEHLAKAAAKKKGIIEALAEYIKVPISQQATKASLAAMFYLISQDGEIAKKCVNMGLIPLLLEILVDSDKSMTEKALAILDAAWSCDLGKEIACGHGLTIPVLAKKMFRVSDMSTELVVSMFWKLCWKCGGRCLAECLQNGVFQKLVLLLQVGCSESTKVKATEMLKMMSGCNEELECIDTLDLRGLNRAS